MRDKNDFREELPRVELVPIELYLINPCMNVFQIYSRILYVVLGTVRMELASNGHISNTLGLVDWLVIEVKQLFTV